HRQRAADRGEVQRVEKRLPEQSVAEEVGVVAEADDADVVDVAERVNVEVSDAEEQRSEHRKQKKEKDDRQARADKENRRSTLVHREAARASTHLRFASV